MASTKQQEQKLVQDKVGQVREVVKNASTNDIILALHNFDMNVERTIHAFCEGGFDLAIGDWEKTGGAAKKKSNQKKKAKNGSAKTLSTSSISSSLSSVNQVLNGGSGAGITGHQTTAYKQPQEKALPKPLPIVNGVPKPVMSKTTPVYSPPNMVDYSNGASNKSSSNAANLAKCFKEIRDILDMRERILASELANAESERVPVRLVCDPSTIISQVVQLGDVIRLGEGKPSNTFQTAQPSVPPVAKQQQTLPPITQQPSSQISGGGNNKRANSPSSQVSSVGETDSGIGQVSPVHQAVKKNMAQVKENGIGIESDAFSAAELAELQRSLVAELKAKGIDPSVLSSLPATTGPRPRRPPSSKEDSSGGKEGGGKHSSGNNRPSNNKNSAGQNGGGPKSSGGGGKKAPVRG